MRKSSRWFNSRFPWTTCQCSFGRTLNPTLPPTHPLMCEYVWWRTSTVQPVILCRLRSAVCVNSWTWLAVQKHFEPSTRLEKSSIESIHYLEGLFENGLTLENTRNTLKVDHSWTFVLPFCGCLSHTVQHHAGVTGLKSMKSWFSSHFRPLV